MLDRVSPPQLDPDETTLTAEGHDCLIVLLPHRGLGGVSIVVWLESDKAAVTWAQVGRLGSTHDDLDLGVWIARFVVNPASPNFEPIVECAREQLARPIVLKVYGSSAKLLVRDSQDRLRRVGTIGPRFLGLRRLLHRVPDQEAEVRFVDSSPPPITAPSGVDEWFRT